MYDLDKPLHVQYGKWLGRLLVLDLGVSFSPDGRPVSAKILERLPITVFLNVLSMVLIFLIAIPIGVLSAVRQGSTFDRVMSVFVFVGFAIPTFWLALGRTARQSSRRGRRDPGQGHAGRNEEAPRR